MQKSTNNPSGFKDDSTGLNDTTDDYAYDINGNMTRDDNKKIATITYNHLNLPLEIIFTPATPVKKINYLYNAAGQKLKKTVTNGTVVTTTDYLSGFQYLQATTAGTAVLKFFPTAEGYVNNTVVGTNNTYNYVYNYTDHLGNVRLSYTKSAGASVITVMQESHYYPFGLQQSGYNMTKLDYDNNDGFLNLNPCTNCPNKYKYQGQERQDELSLNWDSFKWRNYDYAIGRFMSIDPLAMEYLYNSPYAFQENKMGMGTELEGKELKLFKALYNTAAAKISNTYHNSKLSSDVSRAYTNSGLRQAVNGISSLVTPEKAYKEEKLSNKDISVSLSVSDGGGQNQKTTGQVDDYQNVDGFVAAANASGPAGTGNKFDSFAQGVKLVSDVVGITAIAVDVKESAEIDIAKAKKEDNKKDPDSIQVETWVKGVKVDEIRKASKDFE